MIRELRSSDIPFVVRIEEATLGESLGEAMLSRYVDNQMCVSYVYDIDNIVAGYISCNFDGDALEVCNLCIASNYQNKGYGTKLLAYALNEAYIRGAQTSVIDVRDNNLRAIHLYEKLGYKRIHIRKNYYKNGDDAIVLLKQFTPYMDLEDAYLQCFAKFEYHDKYVKIFDEVQIDKYYHNYYRVFDKSIIKELMDKPFGDNILQFQLTEKALEFENDAYDINNDIYMSAFISNITPLKDTSKKANLITEEDRAEYIEFSYNDSKVYGESYAMKNSLRTASMALDEKKILLFNIKKDDGHIIGSLKCFIYNDLAKIEDFYVSDIYHHQGYGTSLFMSAIEYIKENYKNTIQVILTADNCDTPKEMYYKMGFRKCGEYHLYRRK